MIALVSGLLAGVAIGVYLAITGTHISDLSTKLGSLSIMSVILALIGSTLYHAICEYICGTSLGKLIFKIHVVNKDGYPISIKAALIRSAAYFVDSMFFGAVAYMSMTKSRLNQRLGDEWANTAVVERSKLTQSQLPPWWKYVAAFAIAAMVDGVILGLAVIVKLF
jgi:uncharacterized RDD family membrane protein YckC